MDECTETAYDQRRDATQKPIYFCVRFVGNSPEARLKIPIVFKAHEGDTKTMFILNMALCLEVPPITADKWDLNITNNNAIVNNFIENDEKLRLVDELPVVTLNTNYNLK